MRPASSFLFIQLSNSRVKNVDGQVLHAMILGLVHPVTGQYLEVEAPLPLYFRNLLERL